MLVLIRQSIKSIAYFTWIHVLYLSWKCTSGSSFASSEPGLAGFLSRLRLSVLLVAIFGRARSHQGVHEEPIGQVFVVHQALRLLRQGLQPVDGWYHHVKIVQLSCCASLGLDAWRIMLVYHLELRDVLHWFGLLLYPSRDLDADCAFAYCTPHLKQTPTLQQPKLLLMLELWHRVSLLERSQLWRCYLSHFCESAHESMHQTCLLQPLGLSSLWPLNF